MYDTPSATTAISSVNIPITGLAINWNTIANTSPIDTAIVIP